jgi:hypothetical protein
VIAAMMRGAQIRFERAQLVVDAELQVEEARIDALDLDREGARSAFAGGDRVACHARNAQWSPRMGSLFFTKQ